MQLETSLTQRQIKIVEKCLILSSDVETSTWLRVPQLGTVVMTFATYIRYFDTNGKLKAQIMLVHFHLKASKHFRLQKGSHCKVNTAHTQVTVIPRVRLSPEGLAATDEVSTLKVWALGKKNGRTTTTSHRRLSEMKLAATTMLLDLFNTASLHQGIPHRSAF